MTFRELYELMRQFVQDHPDHEALKRRVVVRLEVDEILNVGGLNLASVDAGCTDHYALVLDADQSPDDDLEESNDE